MKFIMLLKNLIDYAIMCLNGNVLYALCSFKAMQRGGGVMTEDIVVAFRHFLQKLNDSEDALDPNVIREAVGDICRISDVAKLEITFYENIELEGSDNRVKLVLYENGVHDDNVIVDRRVTDGGGVVIYEFFHLNGGAEWCDRIRNRLALMISILFVFNSRQMLKQVANRFAYIDESGYHNLRYFCTQVESLGGKNDLQGKAVAHFNLRHFQAVNNQIGRKNGDTVMRRFIDDLEALTGCEIPVCRIGGDNFITIFDADKVDAVFGHLSGAVVRFGEDYGESIMLSATAGIYIVEADYRYAGISDLLDKVMPTSYIAKSAGREDIIFYSEELVNTKKHNATIQHIFPEALKKEEFLVYYQPKVDVRDGRMTGAEALCRWKHDGRLIPPDEFIPILEQNTDICKLDFYMIDHVCRDIRQWLDEGRQLPRISVNFSRKHILDVDLLKHLMEIIDRHNIPHHLIEAELTETTTDVEFKDLKRVVNGLQERGISASVDDFGSGYSSLNLIKEVPWNVIKIDKSIVPIDDDDESSPRTVMFKYVVAMAREMGLECIAEGVETKTQVEILKRYGCDIAQGYHYDRPLPKDEFEKRLDGIGIRK